MYMTQNPVTISILESLQGWLNKKKNPEEYKNKFFRYSGSEYNKRWFKIIEMKGFEEIELAIAYYGSQYDKVPKGWIYLKDVKTINDDTEVFTLVSPQRKLVLEALTKAEHKLWLQGLVDLCHNADLEGIKSAITIPKRIVQKNKYIIEAKETVNPPFINASEKAVDERGGNDTLLANSKQLDRPLDYAADEKSVNSDGSSYTPKKKILNNREDKEDHRLSTFRPGHTTSASKRLHGHIRPGGTSGSAANPKIVQISESRETSTGSGSGIPNGKMGIEYTDDFESIEVLDITKSVDNSEKKATFSKLRRQLNEQKRSSGERESLESDSGIVTSTTSSPAHYTKVSPDSFVGLVDRRRSSMEELLKSSPKLKVNFDGYGDDEFDMKEERARYSNSNSNNNSNSNSSSRGGDGDNDAKSNHVGGGEEGEGEGSGGKKRPPRPPPAASKPPYAQKIKDNSNSNSNNSNNNNSNSNSKSGSSYRKNTPPRRPVDPGINTDENFVNENWDGDGDDTDPHSFGKSSSSNGNNSSGAKEVRYTSGVRPDDNWLDDDFDD